MPNNCDEETKITSNTRNHMSKPPDFNQNTIDLLSQRSAMICNNPKCLTVTVGPSDASGRYKIKLGEAAHIRAAREGEAKFDDTMSDPARADIGNGTMTSGRSNRTERPLPSRCFSICCC